MLKVFDLECYPNFFLAVFKDFKTKTFIKFEISTRKNESKLLFDYLVANKNSQFVGFNIVNYDYPLLHNTVLKDYTKADCASIYKANTEIIDSKYSSIKQKLTKLKLIDLFKVWHYDNKNKSASLKWLEFALRMNSIEDLPFAPGTYLTEDQMDIIIDYCYHDIDATELFFTKSLKHLTLRKEYSKLESEDMMNYSEIAISKAVFGKALAAEMGISRYELNQMRTKRSEVIIKDIIFDYIKFKDPVNIKALNAFKSKTWRYDEDLEKALESIKFTIPYKNVVREYAEGGLHSFGKPGIYSSDDEWVLIDVDFASYYPHITFRNKLHPEHIPEELFNKIYEGFYIDRKKYSKKDARNYVLKIILNGSYGLSKDKHAFLYDPRWQLQICINGQLILTYLTEKVFEEIPDAQIIFENTDGAMYRIRRKDLDKLNKVCKAVGDYVNIPLETQVCEKIIARDVNNYINVIDENNIKFKGCFEIDRDYHKNHSKRIVALALAEYYINGTNPDDFINNYDSKTEINIVKEYDYDSEKPIYYTNHGIFDLCIGSKMKGKNTLWKVEQRNETYFDSYSNSKKLEYLQLKDWIPHDWIPNHYVPSPLYTGQGFPLDVAFKSAIKTSKYKNYIPLSKTNRYVIVKDGNKLIKKLPPLDGSYLTSTDKHKLKVDKDQLNIFDMPDVVDDRIEPVDRESELEVDYDAEVLNFIDDDIINEVTPNINRDYYIREVYKIINKIK